MRYFEFMLVYPIGAEYPYHVLHRSKRFREIKAFFDKSVQEARKIFVVKISARNRRADLFALSGTAETYVMSYCITTLDDLKLENLE